jgi:hypothetical protein
MAQRVPKILPDLRDVPAASPGKLLGWGIDGSPENVSAVDLYARQGIWLGRDPPPIELRITPDQWAAGMPGYYRWEDISGLPNGLALVTADRVDSALEMRAATVRVLDPLRLTAARVSSGLETRPASVNAIGSATKVYADRLAAGLETRPASVLANAKVTAARVSSGMETRPASVVALAAGGVSFVAKNGVGTSIALSAPAAAADGDILILAGDNTTTTTISGWTPIYSAGSDVRAWWMRKSGAVTPVTLAGTKGAALMLAFRGCIASGSPIDVASAAPSASPIAGITTVADGDYIVALLGGHDNDSSFGGGANVTFSGVTGPATTTLVNGTTDITSGDDYAARVAAFGGVQTTHGATGAAAFTVTYGVGESPGANGLLLALKKA